MGPICGRVLADVGAEVIKIEPLIGDNMRRLQHVRASLNDATLSRLKELLISVSHKGLLPGSYNHCTDSRKRHHRSHVWCWRCDSGTGTESCCWQGQQVQSDLIEDNVF